MRSITRLLRVSGFDVEGVENVREAIRATALGRYDVLVSDIGLPDGSGLEVMRHARERHGLRGIAFSGYGTEDDVRASLAAGFEHHLTKPVNIATPIDLIRRIAS